MSATDPRAALDGIALDLGGTKLAAARIVAGTVVARAQVATRGEASADEQVEAMLGMAREVGLTSAHRVGMAVTGRVDPHGVWHAVNTETLSNLAGTDLRRLASSAFRRDVSVINDAQAAALAEHRFGAGAGCAAMAYVTVSTGVGGGFVIDGRTIATPNGLAGHVGFSTCRLATERCGCGRHGTVESIASGRAIVAEALRRGHRVASAKEVFEESHAGSAWASEIVQTSAAAVAELCSNLVAIIGIERVVLGGSIGLAPGYAARVVACLSNEPALFRPDIVPASLGQDGVLLGALLRG